jgi:Ca-activated chloride channel family protein
MVSKADKPHVGTGAQLALATLVALGVLAWQSTRVQDFADLWLTKDQQGMRAFANRDWDRAVETFEDPAWLGTAAYRGGMYEAAAQAFGRIATAEGYFNRGDALMKSRDYRNAIRSFELAVAAAPEWTEAQENLALARYTLDYIEEAREQSDTGDESEMSADEFEFDNEEQRGTEIEITRDSTLDLRSAEKWMRSVDTDTADFLRTRFAIELQRRDGS